MNYEKLIELYKTGEIQNGCSEFHHKILSPAPLGTATELENVISSKFRYTGPGKWIKIIKEAAKNI